MLLDRGVFSIARLLVEHGPREAPHLFGDSRVRGATPVVDRRIEEVVGNGDRGIARRVLDGGKEMVAPGEQRSVLTGGRFAARLLTERFGPLREPIVEETVQAEIVLEMVFSHAPDEDGQAAVYKPVELTLVLLELSDKIFLVHND